MSLPLDGGVLAGQDVVELAAGADLELGEDVAQVVLNGAGGQEQLGADLSIGQPVAGQPGDLGLVRGQFVNARAAGTADVTDAG